jgi:hypothetical protein
MNHAYDQPTTPCESATAPLTIGMYEGAHRVLGFDHDAVEPRERTQRDGSHPLFIHMMINFGTANFIFSVNPVV